MPELAIHVVDDDAAVLDACGFLLESLDYRPTLWSDPKIFLEQAELDQPGIVLTDWNMPWLNGQQLQQALIQRESPLAVIVMTAFGDVPLAVDMLQQGAVDFLEKPVSLHRLQSALNAATKQTLDNYAQWQSKQRFKLLSTKEQAIAAYLVKGYTNKQMADELNVAVRTIEVHRANVMQKMQANSLADLLHQLISLKTDR
ncbi:response regulator [Neisseria dumasiana]|uniref:DNA-binding response regulator n=1 Tax=Neisseria dumasiana TaxID=1931275 RepID=A0A1X3DJQ1_9NEIS|nr:response regulator [Neisseria dumasiana]OSI22044.1 DNA-binding response regulator [Neisseria dumasiana]